MNLAPPPTWQPVDRAAFVNWLTGLLPDTIVGYAGGVRAHPLARYLDYRDGSDELFWYAGYQHHEARVIFADSDLERTHSQEGWVAAFCRALLPPDSYRQVTAAECLRVLEGL